MTIEDKWETSASAGTLLESVRRHARLPFAVAGRKYRLVACALFRSAGREVAESAFWEAIEATEQYADRRASFAAISEAVDRVSEAPGMPGVSGLTTMTLRAMTRHLAAPDPFTAAYQAAAFHQQRTFISSVRSRSVSNDPASEFVRDIFGNPFHPAAFDPAWCMSVAVQLARTMYRSRDFSPMPILADALQDAGCDSDDVLGHCRGPGPHARGCWVVDHVLGKA